MKNPLNKRVTAPIFIESVQNRCELVPMAPVQNSVNFKKACFFLFLSF